MSYAFLSEDPSKMTSTQPNRSSHKRSSTISSWSTSRHPDLPSNAVLCVPVRRNPPLTRTRRSSVSSASPQDVSGPLIFQDARSSANISAMTSNIQNHRSSQSSVLNSSSPMNYKFPPPPTPTPVPRVRSKRSFAHLRSLSLSSAVPKLSSPTPKPKTHKSSASQSRRANVDGSAAERFLAQEVQLAQFINGGSTEKNIRRVTERYARDAGVASSKGPSGKVGGGVSGVHRDSSGGLYWDEAEKLEYEKLLPETPPVHPPRRMSGLPPLSNPAKEQDNNDWKRFSSATSAVSSHRDSDMLSSRHDSVFDPSRIVRPRDSTMINGDDFAPVPSLETRDRRTSTLNDFAAPPVIPLAHEDRGTSRPRFHSRHRAMSLSTPLPDFSRHPMSISSTPRHERRHVQVVQGSAFSSHLASEGRQSFMASSFVPVPSPSSSNPPKEKERTLKRKASRKLAGLFKIRF